MPHSKNLDKASKETQELEEQLVHTHYGLVVSQALRFSSHRSSVEDHIQVGLIGLLKAIRNYDPEKSKFSTFATVCIRNEIFRYTGLTTGICPQREYGNTYQMGLQTKKNWYYR